MARRVRPQQGGLSGTRPLSRAGHASNAGATAHYDDPLYYEKAYQGRRDDVAYYVRLGRLSGGPVLEYGVGTGRIALALARAGLGVTGIDLSRPMLGRLREVLAGEPAMVRKRVRVVHGDMRSARVRHRFPLVIAPFNTVLHLYERRDFEQFLARVREHLAPGGRFVFDFSVPHSDYLGADPGRRYGSPRFRHPVRGLVRYGERFDYDSFSQVLLMALEFSPEDGSAPWTVPLTHRQIFPREIEALLHYNGFSDLTWSADFTDAPGGPTADSLVVSASAHPPSSRPRRALGARRPSGHR